MAMYDYQSPSGGYNGTVSHLGDLVVPNSARRARGKVKGNKRAPRTSVVALTDTRVYKSREDMLADKVAYVVPKRRARTSAKSAAKAATTLHKVLPEVVRLGTTRSLDETKRLNGTD